MSALLRTLARTAAPGFFIPAAGAEPRLGGDAVKAEARIPRALAVLAALLAAAFLAPACADKPVPAPALAARVNGRPITAAQWDEERRFTGPRDVDGARALNGLVDESLILRQGKRLGLQFGASDRAQAVAEAMDGVDPDVLEQSLRGLGLSLAQWQDRVARAAQVDAVVNRILGPDLRASRQEILDRYWDHLLLYRRPARRVLRQIYTLRRGEAESAMNALELGEPFAEVARAKGQGPEAADGGLLGVLARDGLPPALARAAWKLKPGTYSPIVPSHWGYHILYCESLVPGDGDDPDLAAPEARADLLLDKEQAAYRTWLARLRETAVIEIEPAAGPQAAEQGKP